MNNLVILIIISIALIIFVNHKSKDISIVNNDPILDDTSPLKMQNINNGKINVWTFCNNRDYNFKMNWRYPQLKHNYNYPFDKLCTETFIKNMSKYNVNVIVITQKNALHYVPDFPLRLKNSGYEEKKVIDLLGAYILEKYGGLWISPYTITLKTDYDSLFSQLRHNDIITFGTSPNVVNCSPYNGEFNAVNNLIIGAIKHRPVTIKYKQLMESYVFSKPYQYLYNHVNNYPEPLGEAIKYTNPVSIHYGCEYDGSYNINERKITISDYFGKMPLQFKNPNKLLFVSLPYKELEYNTTYVWVKSTPMTELLTSGISVVEVLKSQLKS